MRTLTRIMCAAVAGALMTTQVVLAQAAEPDPIEHATTHVIAKVRPGTTPAFRAGGWTVDGLSARDGRSLAKMFDKWCVCGISAALPVLPATDSKGLDRYYLLHVDAGTDTKQMAAELAAIGVFENVEIDGLGTTAGVPDDPFFDLQYGMHNTGSTGGSPGADIGATVAWDITTGTADVRVAICDSGVNEHVEFDGRLVDGTNAIGGNDWSDSCASHGTHVSGIAAAAGNNGVGVAGVAWSVSIVPIRVLNGCSGSESNLAAGITYAVANDVDVINMSLQYGTGSSLLHDAVQAAYDAGITLVAASGNNGFTSGVAFPGRWPETIAVGGTDDEDEPPSFAAHGWTSNAGPEVDVAAPGDDVYSTTNTTSYGYKSGTSMASPHVAGVVALMLGLDPGLDPESVRDILQTTADDVHDQGFDENTGWGRINAPAALQAVLDGLIVPGDATGDGVVDVEDIVAVILAWGPCDEEGPCPADLDGSGFVDVQDLVEVILNWS